MDSVLFDFLSDYMTLSASEKAVLTELSVIRAFKKGTVLLREGEYTDKGYFVLKGSLRTYFILDGEEKTSGFYLELDSYEPEAKVQSSPSREFLVCSEDCYLLIANEEMELRAFAAFPRFETLCRILTEQALSSKVSEFNTFRTASPEQRYLNLLENRPGLLQRFPQHQIASYLGMAPQSLSRIRQRLTEKT